MINKIWYNGSNDPNMIVRVTDSFVPLDSGRPNKILMGKEKHIKGKPVKRSM